MLVGRICHCSFDWCFCLIGQDLYEITMEGADQIVEVVDEVVGGVVPENSCLELESDEVETCSGGECDRPEFLCRTREDVHINFKAEVRRRLCVVDLTRPLRTGKPLMVRNSVVVKTSDICDNVCNKQGHTACLSDPHLLDMWKVQPPNYECLGPLPGKVHNNSEEKKLIAELDAVYLEHLGTAFVNRYKEVIQMTTQYHLPTQNGDIVSVGGHPNLMPYF